MISKGQWNCAICSKTVSNPAFCCGYFSETECDAAFHFECLVAYIFSVRHEISWLFPPWIITTFMSKCPVCCPVETYKWDTSKTQNLS